VQAVLESSGKLHPVEIAERMNHLRRLVAKIDETPPERSQSA
jgi:hypothetical protein